MSKLIMKKPVAICDFCYKKNLVSEMKKSATNENQRVWYFCSETCSMMYAYENGENVFSGTTIAESHKQYTNTLKKCYPKIYRMRNIQKN